MTPRSALYYVPDVYASIDEITELAKAARRYGGVYFTHQRSEAGHIFGSLEEAFARAITRRQRPGKQGS